MAFRAGWHLTAQEETAKTIGAQKASSK